MNQNLQQQIQTKQLQTFQLALMDKLLSTSFKATQFILEQFSIMFRNFIPTPFNLIDYDLINAPVQMPTCMNHVRLVTLLLCAKS